VRFLRFSLPWGRPHAESRNRSSIVGAISPSSVSLDFSRLLHQRRAMTWLLAALAVLLGVATPIPTSDPFVILPMAVHAQQDPVTLTVYVTRTGEKYHRDGCRYLSRSRIAISLKDAVARGFGPCSVCKPPTLGT
jgi:hypothetical protein